jgi:hypothetical protein
MHGIRSSEAGWDRRLASWVTRTARAELMARGRVLSTKSPGDFSRDGEMISTSVPKLPTSAE